MLALLEVRFDRFALHEAKRAERTPIEINVEAGLGMKEVVFFVKGGDADEIDVSHLIKRFEVHPMFAGMDMDGVLMDVPLFGGDDRFIIAARVEMEAETAEDNAIIIHVVEVIKAKQNKKAFLLEEIVFSCSFRDHCLLLFGTDSSHLPFGEDPGKNSPNEADGPGGEKQDAGDEF